MTVNAYSKFHLNVRDQEGNILESNISYTVYTAGSDTEATIYGDSIGTAKTNPVTAATFATDKGVLFWAITATVDIVVRDNDGHSVRFNGVSPSNWHNLVLPRMQSSGLKHAKLPFSQVAAETSTGFDLPRKCAVMGIMIEVVTAVASGTIDVGLDSTGTNGDADGFCDGVSCATAGYITINPTVTAGSNEKYLSACLAGAYMYVANGLLAGSDAVEDTGTWFPKLLGHIPAASDELTVTYTTSAHAIAGYIHLFYFEFE